MHHQLCSVMFSCVQSFGGIEHTNSEPRCIISCVLLCSVVFTTNTTNSEPQCIISCGGGDFDGDWECFQFRVQLHWDSGIVGDWSWKCFRISSVAIVSALHSEGDKSNFFDVT